MYQAKNIKTGKVHLAWKNETFCGFKNISKNESLSVSQCKEIRHDNVCKKCYVDYCKSMDEEYKKMFPQNYKVWFNGWGINVEATTIKQARHKAYIKFNETYPTPYGKFMSGIEEVEEIA